MQKGKNSDNGINRSNSVIGIKLLSAQSDPIKRRPLYQKINLHVIFELLNRQKHLMNEEVS
jgi:hypothetical protein